MRVAFPASPSSKGPRNSLSPAWAVPLHPTPVAGLCLGKMVPWLLAAGGDEPGAVTWCRPLGNHAVQCRKVQAPHKGPAYCPQPNHCLRLSMDLFPSLQGLVF